MKPKFRPCSRITFTFGWLKYEEIMKTRDLQVGWLLQNMALNYLAVSTPLAVKDDRAFSLLHQELPQILVLCFP